METFFPYDKWWLEGQVEQVIKEQNLLEVFVMMEGYCHFLNERVGLIEKQKSVIFTIFSTVSIKLFNECVLGVNHRRVSFIGYVPMSWMRRHQA